MTREEAARVLTREAEVLTKEADGWVDERVLFETYKTALRMGAAALRGPRPDPITGLVPCGCGGKAFVYCPVDMTDVFVIRCEKCRVGITFAMDLPRAKKEWNTAMGWKGGAE